MYVVITTVSFSFKFLHFVQSTIVHTDHANFDFNCCSTFTEYSF